MSHGVDHFFQILTITYNIVWVIHYPLVLIYFFQILTITYNIEWLSHYLLVLINFFLRFWQLPIT